MSFKRAFPNDLLPCFCDCSGGERSYTTMALLVALGETLETPFRILDEFDVFLDAETRKLVISFLNPPDRHQNAGGPTQQTLTFASQS
jgi:hypothetical protein